MLVRNCATALFELMIFLRNSPGGNCFSIAGASLTSIVRVRRSLRKRSRRKGISVDIADSNACCCAGWLTMIRQLVAVIGFGVAVRMALVRICSDGWSMMNCCHAVLKASGVKGSERCSSVAIGAIFDVSEIRIVLGGPLGVLRDGVGGVGRIVGDTAGLGCIDGGIGLRPVDATGAVCAGVAL